MEFLREFSCPLMFMAGGFISAIIFYPGRKQKQQTINTDYLAAMLSFQWHAGVHFAQHNKDYPELNEDFIAPASMRLSYHFKPSAEIVAARIFK